MGKVLIAKVVQDFLHDAEAVGALLFLIVLK
jgi:hypothetical protein